VNNACTRLEHKRVFPCKACKVLYIFGGQLGCAQRSLAPSETFSVLRAATVVSKLQGCNPVDFPVSIKIVAMCCDEEYIFFAQRPGLLLKICSTLQKLSVDRAGLYIRTHFTAVLMAVLPSLTGEVAAAAALVTAADEPAAAVAVGPPRPAARTNPGR